jgi:phospholipase C
MRTRFPTTRRARWRLAVVALAAVATAAVATDPRPHGGISADAATAFSTPIRHVVVLYQENHSFDNVLGSWCVTTHRCNGSTVGRLPDGSTIPLGPATDVVPRVDHQHADQTLAVDGGRMDGFSRIRGCGAATGYACMTQFSPSQIPNLIALAGRFTVSDATFEAHAQPSWGSHLELVAGRPDGFLGDNPVASVTGAVPRNGWGCDSHEDTMWRATRHSPYQMVPACVPQPNGSGPYRSSPVPWVATVMDRLQAAGRSWRIYETTNSKTGPPYGWAICPTFADCLDTGQRHNMVPSGQVLTDAAAGTLPNLSLVMPAGPLSQHNANSMLLGDNWIGRAVSAIEQGPQWSSTAIFIAYDDCGCFYDHVPPPPKLGIRVPMVIVSPYARPGFTDHTTASLTSILAYVDHAFNLAPLGGDATAYPYTNAFDYSQTPLAGAPLRQRPLPAAERAFLRAHPAPPDTT